MALLIIALIFCAGLIAWIASRPYRVKRRRQAIMATPFPSEWRAILKKNVPFFYSLPTDLQLQLKNHIKVLIAEKEFQGYQGVEINDEIRVTIAAQAGLLLLNRPTDYFAKLRTILVYPAAFFNPQLTRDAMGVMQQDDKILLGESWSTGKVILSWKDTLDGADDPFDGTNVVIHEFAHQLDQESGTANGAPVMRGSEAYAKWSDIFTREFNDLQRRRAHGQESVLRYYGATNPAEFFAVATETFFEKSQEMQEHHPELYERLKDYYQVNPLSWQ